MMINELKRIWRNYKYNFLFLIVIEILFLIEFKAELIVYFPSMEDKIFFGTFIQLFTLISFIFFNHFKSNLNDFELVQPFARIKTFFHRNILFITYFFTLYVLKNLFILKTDEFYAWIPNLFICLLFIITIYTYFMNFRKSFFVYTSIIVTLCIFLFLVFGIIFDEVFLSFTMSVIKNIISIFLIIILYPLFMYLFNYVKNQEYQKSIIKRAFLGITFLLILAFLLPILSVSRCKVYVPINYSGYITFRSPMIKPKFVRMFNSSTYKYYSIEEKQFIKRDNSKSILFKNKYGIIIESISNQVTLATNDF
ncbi:hypothetical protein KAU33_12735, partial [Candidatus Dependentiae bacterium]|nr:hypothetical protein [Candidatus Dependentiae bacterium]